ncbi:MAG: 4'-phosphopantetheinyl transferase superfamily protein [Actinobacteria bacterium]|nr:4'-phosphopantetheinyl transferase superfamily protein [Actinomycetota bacterium]
MTQLRWQSGPVRPRLAGDAVDVWLVALDGAPPGAPADAPLSAAERERAARFASDEDRARWTTARAALRELLGGYLGVPPDALRFADGPHGKPELAGGEGPAGGEALRFNLSHSGGTALIAVAQGREVGIDVELPRRAVDHVAIARRVLDAAAAERIAALEDPRERERAFLRAWVRWEAVLKCRGTGIGGGEAPPTGPRPWVVDLDLDPPGAAALAVERGPATVHTWRWPPAQS